MNRYIVIYYDGMEYDAALLHAEPEQATSDRTKRKHMHSDDDLIAIIPILSDQDILITCGDKAVAIAELEVWQ